MRKITNNAAFRLMAMLGAFAASASGAASALKLSAAKAEPQHTPREPYKYGSNKDRNSGGNRVSQKKRRIQARRTASH
jgi:hypothetical protein